MPLNVRFEGDLAVLSNFGSLLNDPRYVDAGQEVRGLLDRGYRHFVIDLSGIRELGEAALGLLTTITRLARNSGGEVVLARLTPKAERALDEMRLDAYWDVVEGVEAARAFFDRRP